MFFVTIFITLNGKCNSKGIMVSPDYTVS